MVAYKGEFFFFFYYCVVGVGFWKKKKKNFISYSFNRYGSRGGHKIRKATKLGNQNKD